MKGNGPKPSPETDNGQPSPVWEDDDPHENIGDEAEDDPKPGKN